MLNIQLSHTTALNFSNSGDDSDSPSDDDPGLQLSLVVGQGIESDDGFGFNLDGSDEDEDDRRSEFASDDSTKNDDIASRGFEDLEDDNDEPCVIDANDFRPNEGIIKVLSKVYLEMQCVNVTLGQWTKAITR